MITFAHLSNLNGRYLAKLAEPGFMDFRRLKKKKKKTPVPGFGAGARRVFVPPLQVDYDTPGLK